MPRLIRISLMLALTALPAAADCRFKALIDETIAASDADRIRIDVGAGSLDVVGAPNLDHVRIHGTACASSADLLDALGVETDRRGDDIVVVATKPDDEWHGLARRYAYIDLVVEVPAEASVAVDDGSGDLEIRHVRSAKVDDGSGSIRIEDVEEGVHVEDGSGEIDIRDVRGTVWVNDGSGSVEIDRVGGVEIDSDGSGELVMTDVDGDALVRVDGSGSIRVRGVGGDFTVRSDGSGEIDHRDVAGRVSLPRD